MTTIICGSRRYEVTAEDRLWLLRAVDAECIDDDSDLDERAVAQTLCNLFAFLHSRYPKTIPTLVGLVRSYAQPVNPRWYPDGDLFAKWHARDPIKYSLVAAQSRLKKSTRTVFDHAVYVAVERALTLGPVDVPANATDYAAKWIDARRKRYFPLTPKTTGVNRLWTRAVAWKGYTVEA